MPPTGGGAQPVLLTRLHVRYTASTFPEDLMFTQTKDRQNWQTRYVIQNPYASTIAACSDKTGQADCDGMCRSRVGEVQEFLKQASRAPRDGYPLPKEYLNKSSDVLMSDCAKSCADSKRGALEAASKYYERELPERLAKEKQTLAKLTGWPMADIDKMGGSVSGVKPVGTGDVQVPETRTWWQKLFGVVGVKRTLAG